MKKMTPADKKVLQAFLSYVQRIESSEAKIAYVKRMVINNQARDSVLWHKIFNNQNNPEGWEVTRRQILGWYNEDEGPNS